MSIKIKVRATSETVLDDVEIQHQRRRDRLVRKVGSQVNVPTMTTPSFSHVLCFHTVWCGLLKVQQFGQPPSRNGGPFGTRVNGTSTEMITKCI